VGIFLCRERESKAGLSEGEGGGVAGFFSRKIPVTDSSINLYA